CVQAELAQALADVAPRTAEVPFYSTVTGGLLDTSGLDGEYWYRNLRQTVEFEQATRALLADGYRAFIESSPHPVLTMAVGETDADAVAVGTLRRDEGGMERLLLSLGEAWTHGVNVDWAPAFEGTGARRVELPTYAFQRQRYWMESAPALTSATDGLWTELELQDPARLSQTLQVSPQALGEVLPALSAWRQDRERGRRVDSWRYRVSWRPLSLPSGAALTGRWLVVCPEGGGASDVVRGLEAAGVDLLPVVTAEGPGQSRESLAAALAEVAGQPMAGVLSLLAAEERPHPGHPDVPGGVALTLALVQALGDTGIDAPLWCVTRGAAVVGAGEPPGAPAQAAVAGLVRSAALEHPDRWGGLVDLPGELDERAVRRLCAVLAGVSDEDQVAVRSTGVYGRRLQAASARRTGSTDGWRPRGTILVTGGTGGVGAHVARWLAGQGAEHLLLVSRRGAKAPGADALRAELLELGTAVTIAACDVADRDEVTELLAALPAGQPLTAVIHAAGVLDDGVLDALTPERLATSLRAKLTAARHLDELTRNQELSVFVVFTSVMGVTGSAGQGNYAAANAALEQLVAVRRAAGLPATAIAWGAWASGEGMLADRVAERLRERGLPSMAPESAVTAVGRAIEEDDELLVVADADWRRFAASAGLRSTAFFSELPDFEAVSDPGERAEQDGELRARLAGLTRSDQEAFVTDLVRTQAAAVLRHGTADALLPDRAFSEAGFDSLTAVELRNRLSAATGLRLPATVLFDHPTPRALAGQLLGRLGGFEEPAQEEKQASGPRTADRHSEPIAIVGMGCHFPGGVQSPADLWELLADGRDAVGEWPLDRGWDVERLYDPDPDRPGTTYSRQGGFLDDISGFDAEFFGISPREALAMDPQQRLLLETAWEAVESAGQDPAALRGRRVGVFVGTNGQDYIGLLGQAEGASEGHFLTGNTASVLSGRISYVLGLEGSALTVDTACSSSLVALDLAVQALRRGDCDQAFAGGVTLMSTPKLFVEFSRQRGLAPDGRCKAFAAGADGTGWGEGVGVLLLERLSDAQANGHRVLAVVRGSAVNQDGASNGLTAPNGPAQQRVIRAALADAALDAGQVDAVEAHGTGTRLGDPIEAQALQAVYGAGRAADPLWLGSVKSNIGHTQAAAGVAGVIKMVLALQAGELPPTLHIEEPNPHVDWTDGGVRLLTERLPWPRTGEPRRAGVSSFGISGTNVHLILEQAPETQPSVNSTSDGRSSTKGVVAPVLLSARTAPALRAQAARLGSYLDEHPKGLELADLRYSLASGRAALDHRAAVLGTDLESVRNSLRALAEGRSSGRLISGAAATPRRTAMLFPGQGSQRAGAGAQLYRDEPVFADALDEVLSHLGPHLDLPLRDVMFAAPGDPEADLLQRTRCTQPALFALEVALFRLAGHWGLRPDLLLGHSIGELAAAHVAGVFDLADACALVAARGRLMDALPPGGAMTAVEATEEEVRQALTDDGGAAIAAVNGPRSTVLSGDRAAVAELAEAFAAQGRRTKDLAVSHAFHSARMDAMLDAFRDVAEGLTYSAPRLTVISNLTGAPATAAELCDPEYWVRQVRGTVRFLDGALRLRAEGVTDCLELGPGGLLSGLVHECLADDPGVRAVPMLREGRPEPESVGAALAGLYVRGVAVDWSPDWQGRSVRRLELPSYPFQHQRFWPEPQSAPTARLRYRVDWQPVVRQPSTVALSCRWLLVVPAEHTHHATVRACEQALAEHGAQVTVIPVAADAERAELAARMGEEAAGVLSLLALADTPHPRLASLDCGLATTLLLIQALGDAGCDARLWCATTGAVAEGDLGPAHPEQASVWGLGRVAALEHPHRWGGLVDLPEELDADARRALCAVLSQPWDGDSHEDQVAVRPTGVLARRLRRTPEPTAREEQAWTPRGTVLITGGTGGLGAQVARRLAEQGADHLVLLSRRGPDADGAARLREELTELGVRTTVLACDVADRSELAAVVEQLRADGETVRTVFHAAGLTSDTRIAECTLERLAEETAAKLLGAAHLDGLFADQELDAFVFFSSVSATWGSGGQGSYAAANAYLDALAERRRSRGLAATSIAWGPWAGAGMAQGAVGAELRRHGLIPMAPETALAELQGALDRRETGIAVADVDWATFAPAFRSGRDSALLSDLPEACPAEPARTGDPDTGTAWRDRLTGLAAPERLRLLTDLVRTEAATVLGHESALAVEAERPFREAGFDSLTAIELRNRLTEATGVALPATAVFDHPTAADLAGQLLAELTGTGPGTVEAAPAAATAPDAEPLAVVAMACRFPGGVHTPDDLWRLVADEVDAIGEMPADRGWPLEELYHPDAEHEGTCYTRAGGFLDGAGEFDAEFFGISPREALAMDPQQRLLLEASWEVLERACIDPQSVRGSQGGVYFGVAGQGYGTGPQDGTADVEGHLLGGTVTSVASGRVAYTLGLQGPAVTVETACSSSLVALHLAGQALRAGECSFALVGGAAVMATPDLFVEFSRQRGLSTDGRCRSFADAADGTGWGEGAGVLLVERLSDARAQGHPVLALVRGTAVNQDGASNGLTAPNGPAQQRVIRQALANAGVEAADVDLVEAHGTGTTLGDPIEAQAVLATYGQGRPEDRPLWLGSLKSNIGHTQAAAGVAGVIKTVLALRHRTLPRTLHVDQPSTRVDWSAGTVRLLTEARPWQDPGRPRRAGVSAFGMSGTNAHAVLEEAPADAHAVREETPADAHAATGEMPVDAPATEPGTEPTTATSRTVCWPLSAKSQGALRDQARRLRDHLRAHPEARPADIAHALAATRSSFAHRTVIVGTDRNHLLDALADVAQAAPTPCAVDGRAHDGRTVFVFPGQGSQWVGMATGLLGESVVFAERLAECERALAPYVDWSLTAVLRGEEGAPSLERVDVVQPALFAVMVSLAALWRSYGVEPDAVVGHSQGEIAAACVAGALSLDDAAKIVALRSRALAALAGRGGMVSLAVSEERARELLLPHGERIGVAAINGPEAVVVAGTPEELTALLDDCARQGIRARRIPVDYAAHSAQVAEIGAELRTALAGIRPRPAKTPLYSTVTGELLDGAVLSGDYWYRNLREPVEFAAATRTLLDAGHDLFIEVSPHPVLLPAVEHTAESAGRPVAGVGTLRREDGGTDRIAAALAQAWAYGATVDWNALLPEPVRRVTLPTYAFQRRRYWLPTPGRYGTTTPVALDRSPTPQAEPEAQQADGLAALTEPDRRRAVLDLVVGHAAAILGHTGPAAVDAERAFSEAGFDSMLAVKYRNRLSEALGMPIPPTAVFDHPTPAALAAHLSTVLGEATSPTVPVLAELDRLADTLAALSPDPSGTDEIGARLQILLRGWTERTGQGGDTKDGSALDSATADELFELLDNDFGMA
ncbi:SDR family NAD(P)-dependent oxidoreductase, partial [Streptomyces sp. RY43-2]